MQLYQILSVPSRRVAKQKHLLRERIDDYFSTRQEHAARHTKPLASSGYQMQAPLFTQVPCRTTGIECAGCQYHRLNLRVISPGWQHPFKSDLDENTEPVAMWRNSPNYFVLRHLRRTTLFADLFLGAATRTVYAGVSPQRFTQGARRCARQRMDRPGTRV